MKLIEKDGQKSNKLSDKEDTILPLYMHKIIKKKKKSILIKAFFIF